MKKILFFIILLLPVFVFAKMNVEYDWSTDDNNNELFFLEEKSDNYSFIAINSTQDEYYYESFSLNGKLLNKDRLNNHEIELKYPIFGYYLLDAEKQYMISINGSNPFIQDYENTFSIDVLEMDEDQAHEYFGDYYGLYLILTRINYDIYYNYLDRDNNNNYYFIIGSTFKIYNSLGDEIFSKELDKVEDGVATVADDYVYYLKYDSNNNYIIQIYNMNGDLVEEKDITEYLELRYDKYNPPAFIKVVSDGILVGINVDLGHSNNASSTGKKYLPTNLINISNKPLNTQFLVKTSDYKTIVYKFSNSYTISTKVKGQGKIKVDNKKSTSGKDVTFTIEPEKGYVLSAVKVTDANGNVIEFKDYTFTMPSADVTIEAVFELEHKDETQNPLTIDTILIIIPTLLVIGVVVGLMYKKVSWLK